MTTDLKEIKGGASEAGSWELMKGYYDSDGQPVSNVNLYATLRITVGPNGPSYSVLQKAKIEEIKKRSAMLKKYRRRTHLE